MSHIPEEFNWDGVIFCLKCEIDHLIKALMPLPIKKAEELITKFQAFPAILDQNLSYKKRLDLEKKLEHLPIKIFWCPTSKNTVYHFQNAVLKLSLEKPLLSLKIDDGLNRDLFIKELGEFENLYSISDFTLNYKDENFLQGVTQTLDKQSIFSKNEIILFINNFKTYCEDILKHAIDKSVNITACQIAYFSSEESLEIEKEMHVNLTQENIFSEDFHLFLPDFLVRAIYCKLVQLSQQEISDRMDTELFKQDIFGMAEMIYIVFNNWLKLKDIPEILIVNFDANLLNSHPEKINHASGAGILITWKLEMDGIPQHRFSTLFSLEAIQQLLVVN